MTLAARRFFTQAIEIDEEKLYAAGLLLGRRVCEFCTGNDSKALALCAARSHIVAVR
jgi:hypothetical protein